ncbi:glycosyltransferase [Halanaerobiaceae bacterium Z-7014]|uniref:Glycosyltransferase n=1 Tax=Halonatronomonas betaini TaxID=2778430 RepID=A0A931FA33_9FIRM|nr:glycosyltransferase [Halonatronomonas betaini]MBF8436527.1 glycosyltransferase [Halonatronomonas betaini]
MKIKIIFFLSNLDGGGAQRAVVNVINNINNNLFDIKLVLLNYHKDQAYSNLIPEFVDIIDLNTRGRYSVFKIKNLIQKENPDICVATLPQVCKAVMIGHLLSNHNSKVIFRESNYRPKKNMSSINFYLMKMTYKYCDYGIALTKKLKDQMINQYNIGHEKVKIIHNPIDLNYIKSQIQNKKIEINKQHFNLVACGSLIKQKNFSMLIKSIKLVKKEDKYNKIKLNILGTGPLKNKLEKLIKENNLINEVSLLGYKENPHKYMAESDLFILSSFYEGMPNVILESMACKTPVLSTDCPTGPKEILGNNKYGWIVPNNDIEAMANKIKYLFENREELIEMKEKSNERIKDFDVLKIAKKYEDLFLSFK